MQQCAGASWIGAFLALGLALAPACGASSPSPPETATPAHESAEPQPQPAAADGSRKETRTDAVIASVVKQNRQSVRDCYDALVRKHPEAQGNLVIQFTLASDGRVKSAAVNPGRSNLNYPDLSDCATAAIRAMQFPRSSRGFESTINYPFNFKR